MTKHWIGMLMLAGTMVSMTANAALGDGAVLYDNKETGMKATAGMDIRLRLDGFSRSALMPAWEKNTLGSPAPVGEPGPDVYFYRMRTRPWLKLNLDQDIYLYTRLVNDWRYYGSNYTANNNPTSPVSTIGPEEMVFDNIYLHWGKMGGTPLSLRLGRQDMFGLDGKPVIGNGMVVMDGTPYDGSRTAYFDGARLMYETETDTINLFAFYSKHYVDDVLPIIHDRDHMLRDGNEAWMAGIDWKRNIHSAFNLEAYYIYGGSDISTTPTAGDPDPRDRKTFLNTIAAGTAYETHVVGARAFGNPDEIKWLNYSLEYARQFGSIEKASGNDVDCKGDMIDARLGFKIAELINGTPESEPGKPAPSAGLWDLALNLSYTQFGGDDPSTSDFEGWIPTWTGYPIWTEEMTSYLNGGAVWSNFRQYRAELAMKPTSKLTLTPSYAYLQALETGSRFGMGSRTGNGDELGHLFAVFGTYQLTKWWKATVGYQYFIPGDFFNGPGADAEPAHWFRLETTFKF
jgi:hypothetical protein